MKQMVMGQYKNINDAKMIHDFRSIIQTYTLALVLYKTTLRLTMRRH